MDDTLTIPLEEVQEKERRAMLCYRHPQPHIMKPTSNGEKDGTIKRHFTCTKCFMIVQETPEIRAYLDGGVDMNKQMYGNRVF